MSPAFDNTGKCKFLLECDCNKFDVGKTNGNLKTKHNTYIFEIKLKNTFF